MAVAEWVELPAQHTFAAILDPTCYKAKPEGQAGAVRSRMRGVTLTESQLCDVSKMAALAEPARKKAAPRIRNRKRKLKRGEVRVEDACRDFDLPGLIRTDTGEQGRESPGRVDFATCPICGHRDCFRFYPATNTYFCFSDSHPGKCGDALAYIMERDGIAYADAKKALDDLIG